MVVLQGSLQPLAFFDALYFVIVSNTTRAPLCCALHCSLEYTTMHCIVPHGLWILSTALYIAGLHSCEYILGTALHMHSGCSSSVSGVLAGDFLYSRIRRHRASGVHAVALAHADLVIVWCRSSARLLCCLFIVVAFAIVPRQVNSLAEALSKRSPYL